MTALVGTPVTSALLITFLVDFAIQFVVYVYSAIFKTEKYFDFSGSITYLSCVVVALFWRQGDSLADLAPRQFISAAFTVVWAVRLGGYLFWRILKESKDSRFDKIKNNPVRFAIPFFLQVVWVYLTALPVFVILGNPGTSQRPLPSESPVRLLWSDYIGIIIWAFGFIVEVVADYQKTVFKSKYPEKFISTGIWSWSRYANYNGEITLWIGMFILCAGGFVEAWQWVSIVSPLFVAALILLISGVPLLEKSSQKRYGHLPEYQEYKARTSKFFLWPPKRNVQIQINEDDSQGA